MRGYLIAFVVFLIAILSLVVILIFGSHNEEIDKDLIYVAKEETYHLRGLFDFESGPKYKHKLYFESKEDKKYYYAEVSKWEYDNFEAEEGETLTFNYKGNKMSLDDSVVFDEYVKFREANNLPETHED